MTPKRTRTAAAVGLVALLVVAASAAAATAVAGDGGKMTICHKPDEQARTLEVSRNAWPSHRDHGDHEGACDASTSARTGGTGGTGGGKTLEGTSEVSVSVTGDGDADGDATFHVVLRNDGDDAGDVRLTGDLRGDGRWRVRSGDADCTIEGRTLACDVGELAKGAQAHVWLVFDGGPRLCAHPSLYLSVEAGNDGDASDNETGTRAETGACTVVPEPPA